MARVAFVTWDGGGNLPPAIGIAQVLAARGHQSRLLGHEVQRRRIEAQGFSSPNAVTGSRPGHQKGTSFS